MNRRRYLFLLSIPSSPTADPCPFFHPPLPPPPNITIPSDPSPTYPLSSSQTRRLLVPTRQNAIINRLTKTRTIAPTENLATEKEAHLKALRAVANETKKKEKKEEERVRREQRDEKWKREHAYEELHQGLGGDEEGDGQEGGGNNAGLEDEEDFM